MPYFDMTTIFEFVRGDDWAFEAQATATGGETGFSLKCDTAAAIKRVSSDLYIDGITVGYFSGVAAQVLPEISSMFAGSAEQVTHLLTSYTTGLNYDCRSFTPLHIPVRLGGGNLIIISVPATVAALDVCLLTAWGTFIETQTASAPPPNPVSIQKIEVWPWKRG